MTRAYERAYTIFQTWIFSSYIRYAADNRQMPESWFSPNSKFENFGSDIRLLNRRDLSGWSRNLNNLAKGMCFIAFDEALDNMYKPKDQINLAKDYLILEHGVLRVIVYMFRNAIAHNPANPVWRIKRTYQSIGVLKLSQIGFEINISNLDQKPLNDSQYGGADQLLNLMEYCLLVIEDKDYGLNKESA